MTTTQQFKSKVKEQKRYVLKCKRSFQVLFVSLVIMVLFGCSTSTPISPIAIPIPFPEIPSELKTPCPIIKPITSSKPDGVSTWIVGEVDQHSKCILKSKLMVKFVDEVEGYGNKQVTTVKDASK